MVKCMPAPWAYETPHRLLAIRRLHALGFRYEDMDEPRFPRTPDRVLACAQAWVVLARLPHVRDHTAFQAQFDDLKRHLVDSFRLLCPFTSYIPPEHNTSVDSAWAYLNRLMLGGGGGFEATIWDVAPRAIDEGTEVGIEDIRHLFEPPAVDEDERVESGSDEEANQSLFDENSCVQSSDGESSESGLSDR